MSKSIENKYFTAALKPRENGVGYSDVKYFYCGIDMSKNNIYIRKWSDDDVILQDNIEDAIAWAEYPEAYLEGYVNAVFQTWVDNGERYNQLRWTRTGGFVEGKIIKVDWEL